MHVLTIDQGPQGITTSQHPDIADAKRSMADYAALADCWLCPIQLHSQFSSWDLVKVYDGGSLATATVEHVHLTPTGDDRSAAVKQILDNRLGADAGDPPVEGCAPSA